MRKVFEFAFTAPLTVQPQLASRYAWSGDTCTRERVNRTRRTRYCGHRRSVQMQRPPPSHLAIEPEIPEEMRAPEGYKWDPNFPGTIKPGLCEDNYPLEEVLNSGVYERMEYEEKDIDACDPIIHETDEDLLEWLNKQGRLLPRDADVGDDSVAEALATVDDDDNDEDKAMLAYYSRRRDGTSEGSDFGGMSDSSFAEPGGL